MPSGFVRYSTRGPVTPSCTASRIGVIKGVSSADSAKLAAVFHDHRPRLRFVPLEEALSRTALVVDDKESISRCTQPAEPCVRGPHLRLIAVLHERLKHDAWSNEVGEPRNHEGSNEMPFRVAHLVA